MPTTRPATISELAAAAAEAAAPPGRDLKHYIRVAENHRRTGAAYMGRASSNAASASASNASASGGGQEAVGLDMERAFIEYARAATLIVETIPTHRDYQAGLNAEQKRNLKANGEDILENLGKLKAALVERFERYTRAGGSTADAVPLFKAAAAMAANAQQQQQQQQQQYQQRAPPALHTAARQATADEAARWRAQREEAQRRDREAGFGEGAVHPEFRSAYGPSSSSSSAYTSSASGSAYGSSASGGAGAQPQPQPTYLSSASQAAVAAATRAAAAGLPPPSSSSSSASSSSAYAYSSASGAPAVAVPMIPPPGPAPMAVPVSLSGSHSQLGVGGGGGGALAPVPPSFARPGADYGYPSSAGVSFPQPHGEYASHSDSPTSYAASSNYGGSAAGSVPSPSSPYGANASSASQYNPALSRAPSQYGTPAPGPMPLRAPPGEWDWDGESTDEEGGRPLSTISYPGTGMSFPTHAQYGADDLAGGMGRMGLGSDARIDGPTSPSPSTTSHRSAVAYPALARHMSSHQRTQGYVPGAWGSALPPAVPAFVVPESDNANIAGVGAQHAQALGAARAAATAPATGAVGYSTPFSPPPDPRAAAAAAEAATAQARRAEAERSARDDQAREDERRRNGGKARLRTVLLPSATLPRFLAIASGNTARNLETCGLLLGREVVRGATENARTRYVVETLLIPKQHATSDTCTMDEEEGVLGFTEERGLITLGWIHTHPSQSCFMSSVDLHTHASFQCMLPESFAVVCAPKSDPNFGIFRLTDPPGLQTVLKCTAKQAFHPHPDVPIYTDADKGHVQMREAALEIVDLR